MIASLGIREIGRTAGEALAERFSSMQELIGASRADFEAVQTIGPGMAESLSTYLARPANIRLICRLAAAGVNMVEQAPVCQVAESQVRQVAESQQQPLAGLKFVVTGALQQYTRAGITAEIKNAGGAVSGRTDYLVVGERPGSKLRKAESIGVPILTEWEFAKLLAERAG